MEFKLKNKIKLIVFLVLFIFFIGSICLVSFQQKKNIEIEKNETNTETSQENISNESITTPDESIAIPDESTAIPHNEDKKPTENNDDLVDDIIMEDDIILKLPVEDEEKERN